MRHGHHVPLALALGLALAAPCAAASEVVREQSEVTLDGANATSIEVHNARGRIDVKPSTDGAIHVRALKTTRAPDRAEARRLAEQTVVKIARGPAVRIEVVYPRIVHHVNIWKSSSDEDVPRSEVQFSIEIPARLAATLTASSGEIATEGLAGAQTLRSSSGEIRVTGAGGPLDLRTASGDVAVDRGRGRVTTASGNVRWGQAPGPLAIATGSGSVRVEEARDSLRIAAHSGSIDVGRAPAGVTAAAASGDLTVREAAGRVDLETSSGRLEAGLAKGTRSASLRAASGDAVVRLERTIGWTVRASTGSGSIEMDESAVVERRSRRDLEARIRGGGVPVEIRTASGSVRVEGGRP